MRERPKVEDVRKLVQELVIGAKADSPDFDKLNKIAAKLTNKSKTLAKPITHTELGRKPPTIEDIKALVRIIDNYVDSKVIDLVNLNKTAGRLYHKSKTLVDHMATEGVSNNKLVEATTS